MNPNPNNPMDPKVIAGVSLAILALCALGALFVAIIIRVFFLIFSGDNHFEFTDYHSVLCGGVAIIIFGIFCKKFREGIGRDLEEANY